MARLSLYNVRCGCPLPWAPLSGCEPVISAQPRRQTAAAWAADQPWQPAPARLLSQQRSKMEMFCWITGRNDWEKSKGWYISCLMSLQWRSSPASHCLRLLKPDATGQVCRAQFFFPAQDLVELPFPNDCFSDRLKARGTACIQRVTKPGWASFLPWELLWHIPMPCVLLPSCQSPSSSGTRLRRKRAFNAFCLGTENVLLRLLGIQRSEDFSQQRLQVLFVMETSGFAGSSHHSCKCT